MKKLIFIIALCFLNFGILLAENTLESASYSIIELNNIVFNTPSQEQKMTFILKNISGKDVTTKMMISKIVMQENHLAEYCFGEECSFFTSDNNTKETSQFVLAANATTNPNVDSYIKIVPNDIEGIDTLLVTIYNVDNPSDFVQFIAVWNFGTSSIQSISNINLHPIPVVDYVNIPNINNADFIEIYDILGNLIYTEQVNSTDLSLDTRKFNKGTFIGYLIKNNKKINSFKIIK